MYPDNESNLSSKGNSPDRQSPSVGAQPQPQSAADEECRLSGEECSCAAGLPTTTNSSTMTCPECPYPGPGGWGMFPYAYPPMFCYPPPYLMSCPYHVAPYCAAVGTSSSGVSVGPSDHLLTTPPCPFPSRHLLVHTPQFSRPADTSRNSLCSAETPEPEDIALNITSFTDSVGRVWTCTGRARPPPAGRDEPALPLRKKRTKPRSRKLSSLAAHAHAPRDPDEKASCNDLAKRVGPRSDALRSQDPRSDIIRPHDPRSDGHRPHDPRSDTLHPHDPKSDAHRPQDPRSDVLRFQDPKSDAVRPQDPRSDALRPHDPRSDAQRPQDPNSNTLRLQDTKIDALRPHDPRSDALRSQDPRSDIQRPQDTKSDAHSPQDSRRDTQQQQPDPRRDAQHQQDLRSDAQEQKEPRSDAQRPPDPRSDAQHPQEPREEELWSSSSSSGTYDDSEAFDSLKLLTEAGVGEASKQSRQRSRDRLFRRKLGAKPCNAQSQEVVKRRLRSASPRAKAGDQQEGASTSHEPQWAAVPSGRPPHQRSRHAGKSAEARSPRRPGLGVAVPWPQRNADRPREESRHPPYAPPRREPSNRTRRWHTQTEPPVATPDAFPRYRPYEYARGHNEDVEEDGRGRNAVDVFRRLGTVRRVVRCPQPQAPDEDADGGLDFYRRPRSAITVSKTNYLSPRNRKLEEEVQRIQSAADDAPAPGAKGGEGPEYPGVKFDDEEEVDDCKRDPDMEDEED